MKSNNHETVNVYNTKIKKIIMHLDIQTSAYGIDIAG